jgi:hypothetical protein
MGSAAGFICRPCGTAFQAQSGGGFSFDLLHCDTCGTDRAVAHRDLGDIHLRFVKGLPGPYTVSRWKSDSRIQAEYPGEPITTAEYHAMAEASLDDCECGGRFRYDAPSRCPQCRSTEELWDRDPEGWEALYD